MGCSGCTTGRGCGTPAGCRNNGFCATGGCNKLNVYDWLSGLRLPEHGKSFGIVEVRFKNSRKEYFRNEEQVPLQAGDVVAVEAQSGHDIGTVSLTGELVSHQLRKRNISPASREIRKIYRKARQGDIDKWKRAMERERTCMTGARRLARDMGLEMKINDVEFQGDGTKAIFYYTAENRVDFRELIKKLAIEYRTRVEMRQIGIRQEAGRLGGIGSCGRELCCSTWLTDFRTVTTNAARYQQLSINPQKLAGQCGKLKCCLNYELDSYMEAVKEFPAHEARLETGKGIAFHQKTDIFRRLMWYSYADSPETFVSLPVSRVREIMAMNAEGKRPADLLEYSERAERRAPEKVTGYSDVIAEGSLTRFDHKRTRPGRRRPGNRPDRRGRGRGDSRGSGRPPKPSPK